MNVRINSMERWSEVWIIPPAHGYLSVFESIGVRWISHDCMIYCTDMYLYIPLGR
jgi:hypothetical protein